MSTKSYTKTRFSANDAALVLIDHQSRTIQLVHDYSPVEFRNNVIVLAKLGRVSTCLPSWPRASVKVQTARRLSRRW